MIDQDKPRICQVLGVEAGERFRIDYPKGMTAWLHINAEGFVEREGGAKRFKIGNSVAWAVNHPDRILRNPRFTEDEVSDAKALVRILGATQIKRTEYGGDLYAAIGDTAEVVINQDLFPSLRPGQALSLEGVCNEKHRE